MTNTDTEYCLICENTPLKHIGPYINNGYPCFGSFQKLKNYVCPKCGYGTSLPELTVQDMKNFYMSDFRADGSPHSRAGARPLKSKKEMAPRALAHWLLLLMFRQFHKHNTFCDIGAGGDTTFQVAHFLGLDLQNFAYEPDIPIQRLLQKEGVCIVDSNVGSSMKLPSQKMDGIIMSHVLEHFCRSEVIPVLACVREMLSDDGVFVCEVPHVPLLNLPHTRPDDAPHLSFWTAPSLKAAAIKAGLDPIFVATAGKSYSTWAKVQTTRKSNPVKNTLKKFLPDVVLTAARKALSQYRQTKEKLSQKITMPNAYDVFASPHFQYREDGVFLRMVCKKQSSH